MNRALLIGLLFAAGCNPDYDSWDYTSQVVTLASAELHCDSSQLHITPVPDRYGTHEFVVDGCGCTATYDCENHDLDGCERQRLLEPNDASCR